MILSIFSEISAPGASRTAVPPYQRDRQRTHTGYRDYQLFVVYLLHISRPPVYFLYLVAGGVKLLRLVLCCGKGFADRGLFIPVQLLCGKLLKRCGHNVRVPAFEKHKVTGLFALNLFQRKIYVVFLRGTLKGFDIAVGDLDVGTPAFCFISCRMVCFPCGALLFCSKNFLIAFCNACSVSLAAPFPTLTDRAIVFWVTSSCKVSTPFPVNCGYAHLLP